MERFETLETIKVEREGGVVTVVLSRPKALNAINDQMLTELASVLETLASDTSVACLVLTGDGDRAFAAGADIAAMSQYSAEQAQAFAEKGHRIFQQIENFPSPVLGAINGFALGGGCELALACDILYASEKAKMGQPEVTLGLMPGFGGSVRLPRKIGLAAASEWIYTGNVYSAQVAHNVGLVHGVFPPEDLLGEVMKIAKVIESRGSLAVRACKTSMVGGLDTDLASACTHEQVAFGQLFNTADMREGTEAFLEKRQPAFTGK